MPSSYQLLICTMYRLCCGYEWELFTLLVTVWLTLPRPFSGRFHGSSGAWNSALVVKAGLSVLKWEPWGMCASRKITASFFFGHGSSLESMCLTVMSAGRLFSKGLIHKSLWRERESGCLFLTWLGLVNYIVKALLLQQVNAGALRCGCLMVSCCPLLASAALTRKRKYWHMT